jgi:hypothetical protein
LGKGEIGGKSHTGSFIAIAEELEEQLGRRLGKGQIAQLVD